MSCHAQWNAMTWKHFYAVERFECNAMECHPMQCNSSGRANLHLVIPTASITIHLGLQELESDMTAAIISTIKLASSDLLQCCGSQRIRVAKVMELQAKPNSLMFQMCCPPICVPRCFKMYQDVCYSKIGICCSTMGGGNNRPKASSLQEPCQSVVSH